MKKTILMAVSLLMGVVLQAKEVTAQQALGLAKQFRQTQMAKNGVGAKVASLQSDMTLAYTSANAEYYVFNGNGGYVIVSGDDCAAPILGYSDNGCFNADKMPPAMKTWLGIYAKQVAAAAERGVKYVAATTTDHDPIPHLLTTTWDQTEPYNDLCPLDSKGQRTLTGCVATAMAQVANYHKWPVQARGTATALLTEENESISRDMSADVFDWGNMLDTYTNSNDFSVLPDITDEQRKAVALLMCDMGYGVNMKYSASEGSAFSRNIANALIEHFDYDKAIRREMKDWYTEAQWDSIIYNELANGRPVLMGGDIKDGGGHELVCEGYEGDGFYWINWGWGGFCDGKFLLSALNAVEDPSYHFNANVEAFVDVQKPKEGSEYVWILGNWYSIDTYTDEETGEVRIESGMRNYSAVPFDGSMALRATNTTTGEIEHLEIEYESPLLAGYYIRSVSDEILDPLPDGVYKISTEYRPVGGEWTLNRVKLGDARELTVTVSGGKRTYSTPDDASAISTVTDGATAAPAKREVFDIQGVRVATLDGKAQPAGLRPGIYIIKTTDSRGSVTTSKYVAR